MHGSEPRDVNGSPMMCMKTSVMAVLGCHGLIKMRSKDYDVNGQSGKLDAGS
jgi:hypothetical protein